MFLGMKIELFCYMYQKKSNEQVTKKNLTTFLLKILIDQCTHK